MKRAIILLSALLLLVAAVATRASADTLLAQEARFAQNRRFPVYAGPGADYPRSGNGRAEVSTNGWIQVFGVQGSWALIQYEIDSAHWRIGWIDASALDDPASVQTLSFYENPLVLARDCALTDDPQNSGAPFAHLPAGTRVTALASLSSPNNAWYYVRAETAEGTILGFVPMRDTEEPEATTPAEVYADIAQRWPGSLMEDCIAVPGTPDGDYAFALLRAGDVRVLAGYRSNAGAMRFAGATSSAVPQGEGDARLVWHYKGKALYDEATDGLSDHVSDGTAFDVRYEIPDSEYGYRSATFGWTSDGFRLLGWRDSLAFYGVAVAEADRLAYWSSATGEVAYAPNALTALDLWEIDYEALPKRIEDAGGAWN